jgi:3'(2'), 5'-bisphosphate nucleotidase
VADSTDTDCRMWTRVSTWLAVRLKPIGRACTLRPVTSPLDPIWIERRLRRLVPPAQASRLGDLAAGAAAALAGGRAILPFRRGKAGLEVREKAPRDPVTAADHASNHAILGLLARERPGEPVLSEESEPPGEGADTARLWIVDPLDGTREFIDGLDEFAVMVGLAERGAAVLGAVYRPESGILDVGIAAGGAWRARIPAGGSAGASGGRATGASAGSRAGDVQTPLFEPLRIGPGRAGPVRLVHSRSHRPAALDELEASLGAIESIPSGSVGVKCGLIAGGRADLYVHPVPYLKEWDTCAPEAVLRGAGGRVTDCLGERLSYGKLSPAQPRGLLAARPEVWSRVLPIVRHIAPEA